MPRLLLTAGPTREPIDPVRFLSNASTGRQGVALAIEAASRRWRVDLVHGPLEVAVPAGVHAHSVGSSEDMYRACLRLHESCDVLIGAAAVSDYRPVRTLEAKRKRTRERWTLELEPTRDILGELGGRKGTRVHVGFALETDRLLENARRKLESKNLDLIVANPAEAIGAETSRYVLLDRAGDVRELGTLTKSELARVLCDAIQALLDGGPGASESPAGR